MPISISFLNYLYYYCGSVLEWNAWAEVRRQPSLLSSLCKLQSLNSGLRFAQQVLTLWAFSPAFPDPLKQSSGPGRRFLISSSLLAMSQFFSPSKNQLLDPRASGYSTIFLFQFIMLCLFHPKFCPSNDLHLWITHPKLSPWPSPAQPHLSDFTVTDLSRQQL